MSKLAKHMADTIGHGMSEKNERQADIAAEYYGNIIHYPDCWDVIAYPTLEDALQEIGCSVHSEGVI